MAELVAKSPCAGVLPVTAGGGGLAAGGLVAVSRPNVVVETLKPAEDGDGVILRLHEGEGCRGPVTLAFPCPVRSVHRCDLMETDGAALPLEEGRRVTLDLLPWKIVTLRVRI